MPQLEEKQVITQLNMAELAVEHWKLLQALERSAAWAPDPARARLIAQVRYSNERLTVLLERTGMRVVSFDGLKFEVNLPAIAVNAEDIESGRICMVERTLEPAVIAGTNVIIAGKVFIVEAKSED